MKTMNSRPPVRRESIQARAPAVSLELEDLDQVVPGGEVVLETIEVSDGTVGWNVLTTEGRRFLGDIIRITRVRPGGRPRFSYYGKRASHFFGQEFRTKAEATEYVFGLN